MGAIEYAAVTTDLEVVRSRDFAREYPWHFHAEHWTFGKVEAGIIYLETEHGDKALTTGQTFRVAPLVPHKLRIAEGGSLTALCVASGSSTTPGIPAAMAEEFSQAFYRPTLDASSRCFPGKENENGLSAAQEVMRRIMRAPEKPFALEEMAVLSGYSLWHFLRLFRKAAGMTPHAFQRVCRLRLARALIRMGMPAADAAAASGFADQSHLHKVFALHHGGLTPGRFAKVCTALPRVTAAR